MSAPLLAASRLVAIDQVYAPRQDLTTYVADSRGGWVTCDVYHGTTRQHRIRMPRDAFLSIFTNNPKGEIP